MKRGLIFQNGIDIDANWKDRMAIFDVPIIRQPANVVATLAGGGSLPTGTARYYVVAAIGANGESIGSAEVTATPSGGNKKVVVTWTGIDWSPLTEIDEYRIYVGTATGVYNGYFRVFTSVGTFTDDGTIDMVSIGSKSPVTINPIGGVLVGGTFTGTNLYGRSSIILFSEITFHSYTYLPAVNNDVEQRPEQSLLHLRKSDKTVVTINTLDVIYPTGWNTPGSDAGLQQAISDIESFATTP